MNVYVGTNSLKNAYIGEVYEYSYNFRGKSTTILTNDGWSFPQGTSNVGFDSNGMYNSGSAWRTLTRSINLTNAKKITYIANYTLVSTKSVSIRLSSSTGLETANSVGISPSGSTIYWQLFADSTTSANLTGNTQLKMVIDLEAKTLNLYAGTYSKSYTLTDANVSAIKSLSYIGLIVAYSSNYLQDMNITVE